ncbi:MAG: cytochrome c oxidase subunit II [Gemmatimonadetes bacterium]|nr:cytochrome c oxidase subunit II [Gemmatimonadota bacterium]
MQQSTLAPAGPGAAAIESMWWVLFWVCLVVFIIVMVALGLAIVRSRRAAAPGTAGNRMSGEDAPGVERRRVIWVLLAGAAIPAVILVGIFVYTMVVLGRIGPSVGSGDVTVIVTGKQYWWEVRYPLPHGDTVVTANEIHIPVGKRVDLLLRSDDVIHSLWVPRLHGKTDMIPGRTNRAWLVAEEPGVYRGQCAEYCGQQHTWMALFVVAEEEEEFRGWLARQRRPAAPVAPEPNAVEEAMDHAGPELPDSVRAEGLARNARIRRGLEVFLDPENRCANCHVIRGENDAGRGVALGPEEAPGEPPGRTAEGPDLTHVASRISLAGGLLTTNRGNMGGWISNPQVLKPGNLMPRVPLEPDEMNALLDYLMSLR